MRTITLTRDEAWRYRTQDGTLVSFERCTIGKYKGKLFMRVWSEYTEYSEILGKNIDGFKEEYLLMVTKEIRFNDQPRVMGCGTVRILQEIEVDETPLHSKDVFYNVARAAKFAIEDGTVYPGYTFNQYWNGWDCPYFTMKTAMEICKEFSYKYKEDEECRCFYDEETDTFYCEDYNNDYAREEIGHPTEINTPDGKLKVYDFGYAGWIWSEVEENEESEDEDEY